MTSHGIPIPGFAATTGVRLSPSWLALLLFPLGYAATRSIFPELEFASLNVLGALAMAILLASLRGNLVADMAALIILVVFVVGYYAKFYAAEWIVATGAPWVFDAGAESAAHSHSNAIDTFRMLTYGFTACALTCAFAPRYRGPTVVDLPDPPGTLAQQRGVKRLYKIAFIVLPAFMILTAIAQFATGVGVMGSENEALPYHLAGLIFHPREKALPLVIAFLAWLAWVHRLPRWGTAALLLLGVHALMQSFLQASRGQLIIAFLPILLLWMVRREFTTGRRVGIGFVLVLAAILHPLITALRVLRAFGQQLTLDTLLQARTGIDAVVGDQGMNFVLAGIVSIVGRVSGTDTLFAATVWPYPHGFSWAAIQHFLFNPDGLTHARVMTIDIGGYNEITQMIAPTLVGSGLVVGGAMGVVVVCALWTWLLTSLLDYVASRRWRVAQLAWVFVATWGFHETTEFTVLGNVFHPVFWGGGLVLCEWLTRRYVPAGGGEIGRAAI